MGFGEEALIEVGLHSRHFSIIAASSRDRGTGHQRELLTYSG